MVRLVTASAARHCAPSSLRCSRSVSGTERRPEELWLKVLRPPSSGDMCRTALLRNLNPVRRKHSLRIVVQVLFSSASPTLAEL
jgi:hypothetical protein